MPPAPRCGVLGDPVEHSLSPVLHRAGYAEAGLDWEYDAHRVAAGGLAGFVGSLDVAWRGLSVTMPLKREVPAVAAELSDAVRLSGAANTLVRRADGTWAADNTDIAGARAALLERGVDRVVEATVLGGGATAASVGLALCELGTRRLRLLVRSPERAGATLATLRSHPSAPEVVVGRLDDAGPVGGEVVVSTVPANAHDPALVERCAGVPVVFEVLYDPWPTPLAASAGNRVLVGGLDLLVHQAALQFTLFTGLAAPVEVMRRAGADALRRRTAS